MNVKSGSAYSNHLAVKRYTSQRLSTCSETRQQSCLCLVRFGFDTKQGKCLKVSAGRSSSPETWVGVSNNSPVHIVQDYVAWRVRGFSLLATPAQRVYEQPISIIPLPLELANTLLRLFDELIPCPEESYRLWCVVCDLETSIMRRPWLILCLVSATS